MAYRIKSENRLSSITSGWWKLFTMMGSGGAHASGKEWKGVEVNDRMEVRIIWRLERRGEKVRRE